MLHEQRRRMFDELGDAGPVFRPRPCGNETGHAPGGCYNESLMVGVVQW